MLKKEETWTLLVLLVMLGAILLPSLTITGQASSNVVAFDEVVTITHPQEYSIARVVALPSGKASENYIGPYDTALAVTYPEKQVNIENNPSTSEFVEVTFDDEKSVQIPLNTILELPYRTKVSVRNIDNKDLLLTFLIKQGFNTSGLAVREFTTSQTKLIKFILFGLIAVCLFLALRKNH